MMKTFSKEDSRHKAELYDLLALILDNESLKNSLRFKGGTCASMMGILDRFSVDLDFDLLDKDMAGEIGSALEQVFEELGYEIKDKSKNFIQYFLRYDAPPNQRNTIKVNVTDDVSPENIYEPFFLEEIGRYAICQTPETMFANKLFALKNRYDQTEKIAGRDLYDIDYFFRTGLGYNKEVLEERSGVKTLDYMKTLVSFVEENFNEKLIIQDLGALIAQNKLSKARKTLKTNVIRYLKGEIGSLK